MKHLKLAVLGGVLLALPVVGLLLAAAAIYPSYGYLVEADFASLPADDARLIEWLQVQPGVVPHTVHINREGAQKRRLQVVFIQSRNLLGTPPFPDLERGCREMGYDGPAVRFRDVPRH